MLDRVLTNRTVLAIVGIAAVLATLTALRGAIFPFIVGGALSYMLYPIVRFIERLMPPWRETRPSLSRNASIGITYVGILIVLAGTIAIVLPPASVETERFLTTLPDLYDRARLTIEGWNQNLTENIPDELRDQIDETIQEIGTSLFAGGQNVTRNSFGLFTQALSLVIGLVVIPVFLYYVLRDGRKLSDGMTSIFPIPAQPHAKAVIKDINQVLAAYVKAQVTLALVVGVMVFIGLSVVGIRFAIFLALLAAVFAVIPILGPLLGAIPGVLVALATSPEDIMWVILVYVGVQLLENTLLAPRVHGQALHLHPVVVLVVLVLGSQIAGILGVVLGLPIVAASWRVLAYFRDEKNWATIGEQSQTELRDASDEQTLDEAEAVGVAIAARAADSSESV